MSKEVRMKDIADRLGISIVAVSKALSGKEGVSEELRSKVRRTADEIGYNYHAVKVTAGRKNERTGNIGVLASERFIDEDSFYLKYYKHISAFLQQRDYYAFFHTLTVSDEENLILPKLLTADRVDGVIFLGPFSKEYTALLTDSGIPVVFLDFYDDRSDIDCIICDGFYASFDMTNYLIRNGHRKIAFVGTVGATSSIEDRFLGYAKSLIEHGIHISRNYILDDRTEEGMLMDIELPVDMPTAFVCNCDQTANRLIKQLKALGYRIPDDISVTGFDNSVYSSVSEPKITTIEVNTEMMSARAVDVLLAKIEKPDKSVGRIPVSGDIVYKNSVRSLNK
ncbi:MAG: LacI family DNA-binding transcriptional regulator [Oscillospiraceae bacterium]